MPAESAVQPGATGGFDDATAAFIDYLSAYRGCSPHTVKAYARDLREFRKFLSRCLVGRESQPGDRHRAH